MAQKDIGNKVPLHTLKKVEDVAAYYDEWALNNKYDKDMEAWNYTCLLYTSPSPRDNR